MILFDEPQNGGLPSLDDRQAPSAKIRVIGIGGGGGNAVNRMIEAGVQGIEFLTANTDLQALKRNRAPVKLQLGPSLTKGLGAGGDPDMGKKAALEDTERVLQLLDGSDMVFITAGLGGGTGTGAAPIIASLASEIGALTVAVVTKPFSFEGRRRMQMAERGADDLRAAVDTLITIPNERLLSFVEPGTSLTDAFRLADDVLRQAVQGIGDLITIPGEINVDFADVKAVMTGMGMALMGTGTAKGDNRAEEAARRAVSSKLLEETSIQGARGVLLNISGGRDLGLHEVARAAQIIAEAVDQDANIITGMVIDDTLEDEMKVTVIATGFDIGGTGARREPGPRLAPVPLPLRDPSRAVAPTLVRGATSEGARAAASNGRGQSERSAGAGREAPAEAVRVIVDPDAAGAADVRAVEGQEKDTEDIPFYRRVLAYSQNQDGGGFGPNWAQDMEDFDIPTILRKQMD
jgi:cell division protein FtsZ